MRKEIHSVTLDSKAFPKEARGYCKLKIVTNPVSPLYLLFIHSLVLRDMSTAPSKASSP